MKTKNGLEIVQVGPRETLRMSPEDAKKFRAQQAKTGGEKKAPITSAHTGRRRSSSTTTSTTASKRA